MLSPRRPRRDSVAPRTARPAKLGSQREEQLLTWLAELVNLTETEGRATARLWHERVRGGPDGLSRASSDRQWERLKVQLVDHGVPHALRAISAEDYAGEAPGAVAIVMLVGKVGLHRYAARLKRCKAPTCGKRLPPRVPHFHVDPTRGDGLSRRCAECENAAARERFRRGVAEGKDPEQLERRRAIFRVASAKRRARLKKLQARAASKAARLNSHETPQGLASVVDSAIVKPHAAPPALGGAS